VYSLARMMNCSLLEMIPHEVVSFSAGFPHALTEGIRVNPLTRPLPAAAQASIHKWWLHDGTLRSHTALSTCTCRCISSSRHVARMHAWAPHGHVQYTAHIRAYGRMLYRAHQNTSPPQLSLIPESCRHHAPLKLAMKIYLPCHWVSSPINISTSALALLCSL
jgi:hypothetical protein